MTIAMIADVLAATGAGGGAAAAAAVAEGGGRGKGMGMEEEEGGGSVMGMWRGTERGLPGLPAGQVWQKSDLGDFVSIEGGVLDVRDGCLSFVSRDADDGGGVGGGKEVGGGKGAVHNFVNLVGYNRAGLNGAIGVFLWDTGCEMNRIVKEDVGVGGVGNVTVRTKRTVGMVGGVR